MGGELISRGGESEQMIFGNAGIFIFIPVMSPAMIQIRGYSSRGRSSLFSDLGMLDLCEDPPVSAREPRLSIFDCY
jgi:hypothetical protein